MQKGIFSPARLLGHVSKLCSDYIKTSTSPTNRPQDLYSCTTQSHPLYTIVQDKANMGRHKVAYMRKGSYCRGLGSDMPPLSNGQKKFEHTKNSFHTKFHMIIPSTSQNHL